MTDFPAPQAMIGDSGVGDAAPATSGQTDGSSATISALGDAAQSRLDADVRQEADADSGSPTTPSPETTCDGRDEDGDGVVDEGFELGQPCDTGVPGCRLNGLYVCAEDGRRACRRPEGADDEERCNMLDDDCDGRIDEGVPGVGDVCSAGVGLCEAEGFQQCTAGGELACTAIAGPPEQERCNYQDDDCDGSTDEELGLRAPCQTGNGVCAAQGVTVCGENGDVICDAVGAEGSDESCDGIDNDCDGFVDEDRVCGPYVEQKCRFFLGWADRREGPIGNEPVGVSDDFGECPDSENDTFFRERCNSTRGDGRMRRLSLPDSHTFNNDDHLSIAFICEDEDNPELANWVQRSCQISLGYVTENPPNAPTPGWGTCPVADGIDGAFRCIRSGGDGRFHTMVASDRDVDVGGAFAVAFFCQNDDRNRAAAVQSSVEVTFAWAMRYVDGISNGIESWPNCPDLPMAEEARNATCVRTQGFGQYIPMPVTRRWRSRIAVDDRFVFGIGLRARPQN